MGEEVRRKVRGEVRGSERGSGRVRRAEVRWEGESDNEVRGETAGRWRMGERSALYGNPAHLQRPV